MPDRETLGDGHGAETEADGEIADAYRHSCPGSGGKVLEIQINSSLFAVAVEISMSNHTAQGGVWQDAILTPNENGRQ